MGVRTVGFVLTYLEWLANLSKCWEWLAVFMGGVGTTLVTQWIRHLFASHRQESSEQGRKREMLARTRADLENLWRSLDDGKGLGDPEKVSHDGLPHALSVQVQSVKRLFASALAKHRERDDEKRKYPSESDLALRQRQLSERSGRRAGLELQGELNIIKQQIAAKETAFDGIKKESARQLGLTVELIKQLQDKRITETQIENWLKDANERWGKS